jgi:guanylate kinase
MSLVFIISAPSGSGKSTLVNEIRISVPKLEFSVSYTTRKPRGSEQNGREYYYIEREEFEAMIRQDAFLEHAVVFGKDYYGTARRFLAEAEARCHDLLLDIDVQGASQLQQKLPDAISIFILPPSKQELEKRLRRRSSVDQVPTDVIEKRLKAAKREIENYKNYDYILVNAALEDSIERLRAIILSERNSVSGHNAQTPEERKLTELADGCRLENMRASIQSILATFRDPGSSAATN